MESENFHQTRFHSSVNWIWLLNNAFGHSADVRWTVKKNLHENFSCLKKSKCRCRVKLFDFFVCSLLFKTYRHRYEMLSCCPESEYCQAAVVLTSIPSRLGGRTFFSSKVAMSADDALHDDRHSNVQLGHDAYAHSQWVIVQHQHSRFLTPRKRFHFCDSWTSVIML